MIPVKLSLRNFMPYRDNVPPLDFTGIHLASISGDNGSGKSAIIDAITWALWGETRAGARNHDDLIHSQMSEVEVEFEFKVGEQLYRVIRKHARPKRRQASGPSSLDLFAASNGGFRQLSGERIQETQHKITDILHMDYDTFVNSSYLRQGHADQFTVADATERKKVLANILGLSQYDVLEERAKDQARQRESEKLLAESSMKDIDARLAAKPERETGLKQAGEDLAVLENVSREEDTKLTELRRQKDSLEAKEREAAQLGQTISRTQRMIAQLSSQAEQHRIKLKEFEGLLARRLNIEDGYTQLAAGRKLNEELNRKLALVNRLNQKRYELNMVIERAQASVVTEHKLAEADINKLEIITQQLPQLKSDMEQAQAHLRQLTGESEALEQKRINVQQLNIAIHTLQSHKTQLEHNIAEIGEKLALLATQTGAVCPLCERELEEEHRRLIEAKYNSDKRQNSEELKSNQLELAEKQAELKLATNEVLHTEQRLHKETASAQSTISLLEQGMHSAHEASSKIEAENVRLQEIEERLNKRAFAANEQAALKQIEDELAGLAYDAKLHDQIKQRLSELEQWEIPWQKLGEADRVYGQTREALDTAEQHVKEHRTAVEADGRKQQEITGLLDSFTQISVDLPRAENEQKTRDQRRKEAQETVGNLRGQLEAMRQLESSRKEKEAAFNFAAKEENIYAELAEAFGKKGIQALLIEMAIPDLEAAANQLLARMTDNRMHVRFDTQRETKKGDVAETLDILIADELGTRSYEMFSGGEAFRINFAIRIALSKMLAKRAGAPLPTLIIDEGFGTQDDTGLEKLKEAIISIQDDFEKILVITHVEELRDAFPARIDVVKTAAGSTIEITD